MYGAGDQFFAGAAFTLHQYWAIGTGHLANVLEEPTHAAALADNAVKLLNRHDGAVALYFTAQASIFQQALDREQKVVNFQRLGKEVVSAIL